MLEYVESCLICLVFLSWLAEQLIDGWSEESLSEVRRVIVTISVTCLICHLLVIVFVTLLHGFTPRLGVWFMNVECIIIIVGYICH
jgi:hypothetical protein